MMDFDEWTKDLGKGISPHSGHAVKNLDTFYGFWDGDWNEESRLDGEQGESKRLDAKRLPER